VALLLRHDSLDNGNPLAVTTINMPPAISWTRHRDRGFLRLNVNATNRLTVMRDPRGLGVRRGRALQSCRLVFQMQGTLGVESNAAQPLYLNRPVTVGDVKAYVQAAPTGAAITFHDLRGRRGLLTLTIPVCQTAVVATPSQIGALTEIPANTAVLHRHCGGRDNVPRFEPSVFIYS